MIRVAMRRSAGSASLLAIGPTIERSLDRLSSLMLYYSPQFLVKQAKS
jgi:hypothetical protein